VWAKTTFSALLIRTLNAQGKHVLAIDADPDANLAAARESGCGQNRPHREMKDLISKEPKQGPAASAFF
jgi:CO dehydrogenase maturation factor